MIEALLGRSGEKRCHTDLKLHFKEHAEYSASAAWPRLRPYFIKIALNKCMRFIYREDEKMKEPFPIGAAALPPPMKTKEKVEQGKGTADHWDIWATYYPFISFLYSWLKPGTQLNFHLTRVDSALKKTKKKK